MTKYDNTTTINLKDAANMLCMNKETVRRIVNEGKIPGAKIGKCWRFLPEDIVDYMRSMYATPASQGVIYGSRKKWHFTSVEKSTGLGSTTTEKEYKKQLGLPAK